MSLNVSPAQLKKYGLYAVLSFFIGLSTFLLKDDLAVRSKDITIERARQEELRKVVMKQLELQQQQKNLLRDTIYIPITHKK